MNQDEQYNVVRRLLAELGIPYFLMRKDDWAAEKATIDAWLQS